MRKTITIALLIICLLFTLVFSSACIHTHRWTVTEETDTYTIETCTICGITKETDLTAHAHIWEVVGYRAPTCTEAGFNLGTACKLCGQALAIGEELPMIPHQLKYVEEVSATCTSEGMRAHYICTMCNGFFDKDDSEHAVSADALTIERVAHNAKTVDGISPNCTDVGYTEHLICEDCGYVITSPEEIQAIGHKWNEWRTSKLATCADEGEEYRICERCGLQDIRVAAKTNNHVEVVDNGYEATCYYDGLTDGSHCDVCGEVIVKQRTLYRKHIFNGTEYFHDRSLCVYEDDVAFIHYPGIEVVTCLDVGVASFDCAECGGHLLINIRGKHDYASTPELVDDKLIYICKICGEVKLDAEN